MRRIAGVLWCCAVLLGCGGSYEAAVADVTQTPVPDGWEPGQEVAPEESPAPELLAPEENVEEPPVGEPESTPPAPPETPETEGPEYDPEWTEHEDEPVKGCLELFPAICNKLTECGPELPAAGLLGSGCPLLFDSIAPLLTLGCEQIGDLLQDALPDIPIPIGGGLDTLITTLLKGCIENFQCDPDYLGELGGQFGEVIGSLGGGQGGGDFSAALPALLKLAEMCGGVEGLLPF